FFAFPASKQSGYQVHEPERRYRRWPLRGDIRLLTAGAPALGNPRLSKGDPSPKEVVGVRYPRGRGPAAIRSASSEQSARYHLQLGEQHAQPRDDGVAAIEACQQTWQQPEKLPAGQRPAPARSHAEAAHVRGVLDCGPAGD